MLRTGTASLFVTAALAAGCGARSGMFTDTDATSDGGGGAGATTATTATTTSSTSAGAGGSAGTTSTQTGSGGAGGAWIDCSSIAIAGPPAGLDGGFGYHQRRPVWTLSSDDGSRVTLLSAWQLAEGPAGADFAVSIRHATLQPWIDFPSGGMIGPSAVASEDGGATFAAARASEGRFALAFDDTLPPDGGLAFGHLTPFVSGPPSGYSVHPTAREVLFVAQGPSFAPVARHLLGMSIVDEAAGAYGLRAGFAPELGPFKYPTDLGCASAPLRADAVGTESGWLLALSNGSAFAAPECFAPGPGLAWPDEVQIASATHEGSFVQKDSLGAPGGATELKMAPRSDGAWLVIGTPPGQVASGMYLGARVGLDGKVVSTFQVGGGDPSQEIMVTGTLTAASVKDHLAVAWVDVAGDKGPFLRVKTFDPDGNPGGHVEIFPATAFDGPPALLGSPITNSMVLAWSELPAPGSFEASRILAVRIDCVTFE